MKLKKQLLTLLLVVGMIFSLPLTTFAASGNTTVYVTRTGGEVPQQRMSVSAKITDCYILARCSKFWVRCLFQM